MQRETLFCAVHPLVPYLYGLPRDVFWPLDHLPPRRFPNTPGCFTPGMIYPLNFRPSAFGPLDMDGWPIEMDILHLRWHQPRHRSHSKAHIHAVTWLEHTIHDVMTTSFWTPNKLTLTRMLILLPYLACRLNCALDETSMSHLCTSSWVRLIRLKTAKDNFELLAKGGYKHGWYTHTMMQRTLINCYELYCYNRRIVCWSWSRIP